MFAYVTLVALQLGTGGTPAYQGPEVLKRQPVSKKIDLYGFAITYALDVLHAPYIFNSRRYCHLDFEVTHTHTHTHVGFTYACTV
jgi:hypothetical protein